MPKNVSNTGNLNGLIRSIEEIAAMNGQRIEAAHLPMQTDFVRLEKTPEEAIRRARLEAVKKGLKFKDPVPIADHKKESQLMSYKLMNDLIEGILWKNARSSSSSS